MLDRRLFLTTGFAGLTALTAHAQQTPAPPSLAVFGRLPELDHVCLSPDASAAAMCVRRGNAQFLVRFDLKTGETVAHPLGDLKVRDLFWAGNEHVALIKSSTLSANAYSIFRNEQMSVNIQDMRSGKSRLLFHGVENVDPIVLGDVHAIRQANGYALTGSAIRRKDEGSLLFYAFDVRSGQARQLDDAPLGTADWVIRPDGEPVARSFFDSARNIWSLAFRSGRFWPAVLTLPVQTEMPRLYGQGSTDDSVIAFLPEDPRGFVEISAGAEIRDLKGGLYSRPLFHPLSQRFNGFAHLDASTRYEFLSPDMADLPKLAAKYLPRYRIDFVSFAENPRKAIVYGESPQDAGSYHFIDFDSGLVIPLGDTRPDLPARYVGEKLPLKYTASDGVEIEAYLTLPPGRAAKALPLIVLPHGGPEARDTLSFEWDVAAYASRGYAVLQPNFRGSAGYGRAFVEKGYGQLGRRMQTDLSDGVRFLVSQGLVDASRVAIVGYSYGGYAALAGAAFDPGIYKCAVSVAGLSDLPAFVSYISSKTFSPNGQSALYWKRFLGDEAGWPAVSPARHAAKISIPVLLVHGKDDTVVPYTQSQMMFSALKSAGKAVELQTLPGEDHWLSREPTRVQTLTSVIAFIEKHNPAY
ncbi:MAG: prolyl oligopeptidase family serine peptidase [Asticcacaulis sp.]